MDEIKVALRKNPAKAQASANLRRENESMRHAGKNSAMMNSIVSEAGENFYRYIEKLGLANEPNLLVLSSKHHYYYDDSELTDVAAIVNLKSLNLEKRLDSYVQKLNCFLSPRTNFVGYFSDHENDKSADLLSRLYRKVINFLDSRTDRDIDRSEIIRLFESYGLCITDMTDINGITCFSTRKMRLSA